MDFQLYYFYFYYLLSFQVLGVIIAILDLKLSDIPMKMDVSLVGATAMAQWTNFAILSLGSAIVKNK